MYLIAAKTFCTHFAPRTITVISDRLSEESKKVLRRHIDNIEIIDINAVDTYGFPKGGTWERLLTIIDKSENNYVIQLDADTLTLSSPEEVLDCVFNNRSFTLGTEMGREVVTFRQISQMMESYRTKSNHVQIKAELAMGVIDKDDTLKYIRGCSGFAGFAKGQQKREYLKNLSDAIVNQIGKDKWNEWGSEQVASNMVIANSATPMILPIDKYNYFKPGVDLTSFRFLHFVGTFRFRDGVYHSLAKKEIKRLECN